MIRLASAVATIVVTTLTAGQAAADDKGGAADDGFWVEDIRNGQTQEPLKPQQGPQLLPPSTPCGDAVEVTEAELGPAVTYCAESHTTTRTVTVADVRRAFGELKLPPGTLVIQPPDGLTLVNFATNFYTTATTPIATTITLLEQAVTLEATPTSYTWDFGDGHTLTTHEPGAPYPDLTITHDYQHTGDYQPSLATTYTGRYRIADGPWQTIPDTVTIPGPTQALRVIEAQPKLVGY
ncbi:PKD domain-containing protein [Nocardioides sp. R1-1]|uniref:PKD domain-containing protein n=1 Tax=Nocardioides sp. R1-1 TaxID=3383502 RepID=UPI0038CFE818